MTKEKVLDIDANFLGTSMGDLSARLVLMLVVKGVEEDDAQEEVITVMEGIMDHLHTLFDLEDAELQELEEVVNAVYNQRLVDLATEITERLA
jgi:molybdopterin converting factor small subunit